ncbi:MAG: hypothetical protein NXH90_04810 [Flavobacteriaceae bacterium]|nr:hypothetical protein [Flavobacteriaceae bacterium]
MKLFPAKLLLGIVLSFLLCSCSSDDNGGSQEVADFTVSNFTDQRDGTVYKTVKIGTQVWFAENLNYTLGNGQSTCYEEDATNCLFYGQLYNWDDALTACPNGWHLPSEEEWQELFDYLGGIATAEGLLEVGATNLNTKINFDLLAAGWLSNDTYDYLAYTGFYWTSTPGDGTTQLPSSKAIIYSPGTTLEFGQSSLGRGFSCRCVED